MPGLEERKTKRPVGPKSPPWEGRKQAPDAFFSGNQQHELSACTAPKSALGGAGDHPQGWWWGYRRQPIICRNKGQQTVTDDRKRGTRRSVTFRFCSPNRDIRTPAEGFGPSGLKPHHHAAHGPPPPRGRTGLWPCWWVQKEARLPPALEGRKNKRLAFGPAGRGKSTWVVLFFLL